MRERVRSMLGLDGDRDDPGTGTGGGNGDGSGPGGDDDVPLGKLLDAALSVEAPALTHEDGTEGTLRFLEAEFAPQVRGPDPVGGAGYRPVVVSVDVGIDAPTLAGLTATDSVVTGFRGTIDAELDGEGYELSATDDFETETTTDADATALQRRGQTRHELAGRRLPVGVFREDDPDPERPLTVALDGTVRLYDGRPDPDRRIGGVSLTRRWSVDVGAVVSATTCALADADEAD